MKLIDALKMASKSKEASIEFQRPDGALTVTVDEFGEVTFSTSVYLGDFLDFDDWEVSTFRKTYGAEL